MFSAALPPAADCQSVYLQCYPHTLVWGDRNTRFVAWGVMALQKWSIVVWAILVSFTPFLYYSFVLICRMSLCTYIIWLAGWPANKARQKMYMQLHDIQSTTLRYNFVVWHTPHKPYTCGQQRSATESAIGRLIWGEHRETGTEGRWGRRNAQYSSERNGHFHSRTHTWRTHADSILTTPWFIDTWDKSHAPHDMTHELECGANSILKWHTVQLLLCNFNEWVW